jgi:integrase
MNRRLSGLGVVIAIGLLVLALGVQGVRTTHFGLKDAISVVFILPPLLLVPLVRGRSGDHAPISESSVQHLLSLLGRKAEIGRQVHPHFFRHSLATNLLRRNVNPVQVRDILGHSSLAMIDRVYSHVVARDAHQALMEALRAEDRP